MHEIGTNIGEREWLRGMHGDHRHADGAGGLAGVPGGLGLAKLDDARLDRPRVRGAAKDTRE